LAWYVTYS